MTVGLPEHYKELLATSCNAARARTGPVGGRQRDVESFDGQALIVQAHVADGDVVEAAARVETELGNQACPNIIKLPFRGPISKLSFCDISSRFGRAFFVHCARLSSVRSVDDSLTG